MDRIRERIRELVDWFIPHDVKAKALSNQFMRARVLVGLLLISAIGTAFALTTTLRAESFASTEQIFSNGIPVITLCAYVGCLFFLKLNGSIRYTVNFFAVIAYISIVGSGLTIEGIQNTPALQLLIIIPVWTFLIAGRAWGMFWVGIIAITIGSYFAGTMSGTEPPLHTPQSSLMNSQYAVWLLAIVVISVCLFIYENQFESLTKTLAEQNRRFAHEAMHDPLTGLCNRKLFLDHAQQAIDFAISEKLNAAFIYIDLNDFKPVNDTYGHHIGDSILQIIAQRLKSVVRSSDTVARLGGDEFVVLLYGVNNVTSIETTTRKIVRSLGTPINLDDTTITVGASVGVVTVPNEGTQLDEILKRADRAMYNAKNSDKNICFDSANPHAGLQV